MGKKTTAEKKVAKKAKATKEANEKVEKGIEKDQATNLLKAKIKDMKSARQKTTKKKAPNPTGESRANPKNLTRQIKGSRFGRSEW